MKPEDIEAIANATRDKIARMFTVLAFVYAVIKIVEWLLWG